MIIGGATHCACPRDTATQRPRQAEGRATALEACTLRFGGSGKRGAGPEPVPRHVPRRDTWRRICSEPTWRRGGGLRGRGGWESKGPRVGGGGGAEGRGLRRPRQLEAAAWGGGVKRRLRSAGERHDGREGVRGDPLSHQLPWFQLFLCALHLPQYIPIPLQIDSLLKFTNLSLWFSGTPYSI